MRTQLRRRPATLAALVLPVALIGAPAAVTAAPAAAHVAPAAVADAAKAPTTGRFVTTTKKGIVLVDEDGRHRHTIIRTSRRDHAALEQANATTGTLLYSTRSRAGGASPRTTWHVATLYGVELGTFSVPEEVHPVVDSGGYTAYWVQPRKGGMALMKRQVNDPGARPTVVRALGPGTGAGVAISPDNTFVAAATHSGDGLPSELLLVTTDGSSAETLPMPTGETFVDVKPVWSPDSGRIAFETFAAPGSGSAYTLHTAAATGDHTPQRVGAGPGALFDWSPDGRTVLGGLWDASNLIAVDVATGLSRSSSIPRAQGPVFWSGLRAGAVPRDHKRPSLRIARPDCGDRTPAACASYRHTVAAWRVVGGPAADRGGSQLRYVAVSAFQRRGQDWWALVSAPDARHGTWRRFPNRGEAKWHAKERTARIVDGRWHISLPGLTTGRLVVVAMAVDGARNETERQVAQTLR